MKKQIAYILTTYPCRSETFIHNEISLLKEKGLEIVILATSSDPMAQQIQGIEVIYCPSVDSTKALRAVFDCLIKRPLAFCWIVMWTLKYLFCRPTEGLSLVKNLSAICCFTDFIKKTNISHIHGAFLSWPGRMAHVLSKVTRLPYSLAAHARDGYVEGGAIALKVKDAGFVVCCSQAMTEHIQSQLNPDERQKVCTVYHGVSTQLKIEEDHSSHPVITVTAIGRFVPKKGYDCLITAFRKVVEKFDNVSLLLIGDGLERDHLKKLVQECGLAAKVIFRGWLNHQETLQELSKSSLLIVPSVIASDNDRDGIPNVILEAFMLKVPVIASNLPSIQEAIVDGTDGLLFEPDNIIQLRDKMIQFLSDRNLRDQIAERAYEKCNRTFNALSNIEKIYSLFNTAAT